MEPPEQDGRDAPRALDLVGCSGNLRRKLARASDRVRTRRHVHAPPRAFSPLRPNARVLSTASWPDSSGALSFLFEHDLFGKPLHTFPDHALTRSCRGPTHRRGRLEIAPDHRPKTAAQPGQAGITAAPAAPDHRMRKWRDLERNLNAAEPVSTKRGL